MELGGLIVIIAVIAALSALPQMVARRTAITQSREIDRFSPRMRLLHPPRDTAVQCEQATTALLPHSRRIAIETGDDMDTAATSRTRAARPVTPRVREIANLRARRAARISAEAAAGRRRMAVCAALAVAVLVIGVVAAMTPLTWPWVLVPVALLGAELVASRLAARRSRAVGAAELDLLRELRDGAPRPAARPIVVEASTGGDRSQDRPSAAADPVSSPAEEASEGAVEEVAQPLEREDSPDLADAPAPVERRTWSVAPIPAPTYAMRGRVSGRMIHPDTDLRGIPKVEARVPGRPVAATGAPGARSTDEVVASSPVALDLDAVLEARRAQ
ncbi:hypothetical protein M3T53_00365 [Actinomyces sp. B33]|uniref:hypothetical protein n=1 Tax=Actinomyces sp. B33 TaxID=2942131 RepID=UPI002342291B|nr:hypothetical protein [Actinomyces sp. B33]MDC4232171.1 hypothetical protein [Actinomyces sp. B33]